MISFVAALVFTAAYAVLAVLGKSRLERQRPRHKAAPGVSIIIPAYRSEGTIAETLESVRELDYPKKEVIVVNDSKDRTPQIARKLGARVIQNKTRQGKARALNRALKSARGEILFFLDSDTTLDRKALKRAVPWFSENDVGAVMSTYRLKNDHPVARLADVENIFTFALLRIHSLRGTLIGFRGCSVAIRRSVLEKYPWPDVLLEDNYMAANMVRAGYRIIWEPESVAYTTEPESIKEVKRQKKRWGQGAYLAFRDHLRFYLTSLNFMAFFGPYFALGLAAGLMLLGLLVSPMLFPGLTGLLALELGWLFLGMYVHTLVMLYLGGGGFLPGRTLKFMLYYYHAMTYAYARGVLSGIKFRRKNRKGIDFRNW